MQVAVWFEAKPFCLAFVLAALINYKWLSIVAGEKNWELTLEKVELCTFGLKISLAWSKLLERIESSVIVMIYILPQNVYSEN